jgi:uncharacterized cysteine cluster protein YcgN (CxxCxxCC family)
MVSKILILKEEENNLCEKCDEKIRGLCCYYSEFFEGFNLLLTNHPCKFLNPQTHLCNVYHCRREINPNCMGVEEMIISGMIPKECLYVKNNKKYQKRKDTRLIQIPIELSNFGRFQYERLNNESHEEVAIYDVVRTFVCPKCKSPDLEEEWNEETEIDYFIYLCNDCGHQWNTKKETIDFQTKLIGIWKCSKCKKVIAGPLYISDGYCDFCNEYNVLEKYNPLNQKIKPRL